MMFLSIIFFTILIVLIVLIIYEIVDRYRYRSLYQLSAPQMLPLAGNLHHLGNSCQAMRESLTRFVSIFGPTVHFRALNLHAVVLSAPKHIEAVLSSNRVLDKSIIYDFIRPWLGNGLLTANVQRWRKHRKMITPTFHFKILESFLEIFHKQGTILVEKLAEEIDRNIDEELFDIEKYISPCTLDIICETAMGTSVNAQHNTNSIYVQSVKTMCKTVIERLQSPLTINNTIFGWTNGYKKQMEALKVLHAFTRMVIEGRIARLKTNIDEGKHIGAKNTQNKQFNSEINGIIDTHIVSAKIIDANAADKTKIDENSTEKNELKSENENIDTTIDNGLNIKRKMAFLDLLLQQTTLNGQSLDERTIQEEVDTFMFEGHDTTGSALCFALYEISCNIKVQNAILDEQMHIFGDALKLDRKSIVPTYGDLNEMKYLEMVIKETLRLYPSVPSFSRVVNEKTVIDNITLPKGTIIILDAVSLHRNPDLYPKPELFDPERFSPENATNRNPFAFIPFSAGPRNCIGQKFAMLEMKSTLSHILRSYEVYQGVIPHKIVLAAEAVLASATGIKMGIRRRTF